MAPRKKIMTEAWGVLWIDCEGATAAFEMGKTVANT
jgi:hypothetical protein